MNQTSPTAESPLLREWLSNRSNQTQYLKRGQFQSLLSALGMGRHHVDTLFPAGHPDIKRLPNCRDAYYLRSAVLRVLGVSES